MRQSLTRLRTLLPALVGLALLLWLLRHIGVHEMVTTLQRAHAPLVFGVAVLQGLGLWVRLTKVRVYTPEYAPAEAAELFVLSRLGGEISAALYLTPLLKSGFRQVRVAGYVLLDRLLEVGATLALAALAAACLWSVHPFLHLALAVFVAQLLVIVAVVRLPLGRGTSPHPRLDGLVSRINGVRAFLAGHHRTLPKLVALTVLATTLDMAAVFVGFLAVGHVVPPLAIPVIWAVGASVSALTLLGVGPAEVTWVYLFFWLFQVPEVATGSMILVTRATGVALLTAGLGWVLHHRRAAPVVALDGR